MTQEGNYDNIKKIAGNKKKSINRTFKSSVILEKHNKIHTDEMASGLCSPDYMPAEGARRAVEGRGHAGRRWAMAALVMGNYYLKAAMMKS